MSISIKNIKIEIEDVKFRAKMYCNLEIDTVSPKRVLEKKLN